MDSEESPNSTETYSHYKLCSLSRQMQKREQGDHKTNCLSKNEFAKKVQNFRLICAKRQLNQICQKNIISPLYSEQLLRWVQSIASVDI